MGPRPGGGWLTAGRGIPATAGMQNWYRQCTLVTQQLYHRGEYKAFYRTRFLISPPTRHAWRSSLIPTLRSICIIHMSHHVTGPARDNSMYTPRLCNDCVPSTWGPHWIFSCVMSGPNTSTGGGLPYIRDKKVISMKIATIMSKCTQISPFGQFGGNLLVDKKIKVMLINTDKVINDFVDIQSQC